MVANLEKIIISDGIEIQDKEQVINSRVQNKKAASGVPILESPVGFSELDERDSTQLGSLIIPK